MGYIMTNTDRLAMIELLNLTWDVSFRGFREKGEGCITMWLINAIEPTTKTYMTASGQSLTETVDNWFMLAAQRTGTEIEREVWGSLFDAKLDLIKGSEEEE